MRKLTLIALCASLFAPLSASEAQAQKKITNIHQLRQKRDRALARVQKRWEDTMPKAAYKPDGSVDFESKAYKDHKRGWLRESAKVRRQYNALDDRWQRHQKMLKDLGLEGKLKSSGSIPKDLGSDIDLIIEAKNPAEAQQIMKKVKAYEARTSAQLYDASDRLVAVDSDTVYWAKGHEPTAGSSAYDAKVSHMARKKSDAFPTEGGLSYTTDGKLGVHDPKGAVLANINKASDAGLSGDVRKMDVQSANKSLAKTMEITGANTTNRALYEKARAARRHRTEAEAGIVRFGDSEVNKQKQRLAHRAAMESELGRAYEMTSRQSDTLQAERRKEADRKFREAQGHTRSSSYKDGVLLREEEIRVRASNLVTEVELKNKDPELAKKLLGDDATIERHRRRVQTKIGEVAEDLIAGPESASAARPVNRRKPKDFFVPSASKAGAVPVAAAKRYGGRVSHVLGIVGNLADAFTAEQEAAAMSGRDASVLKGMGNALYELASMPGNMYNLTKGLREEELRKADQEHGDNHWGVVATARALVRVGGAVIGADEHAARTIEEIKAEEERARRAGDKPNYTRAQAAAIARTAGEMLGLSSILAAPMTDWGTVRQGEKEMKKLRDYLGARLEEGVHQAQYYESMMVETMTDANLSSSAKAYALRDYIRRYEQARSQLKRAAKVARRQQKLIGTGAMGKIYAALSKMKPASELERFVASVQPPAPAAVAVAKSEPKSEPKSARERATELVDRGVAVRDRGDHAGARRLFDEATKLDPSYHRAYVNLAILAWHRKDWRACERLRIKGASLNPTYAADNTRRAGLCLKEAKDHAGALRHFEKAANLGPNDERNWFELGLAQQNLGYHRKAVDSFRRAASLRGKQEAQAWYRSSLSLAILKDYRACVTDARKAIIKDKNYHWSHRTLGDCYREQGEHSRAVAAYSQSLRLKPTQPWVSYYRGASRFKLRNFKGVAADMSEFLSSGVARWGSGIWLDAHSYRCSSFVMLKRYFAGISDCTEIIMVDDRHEDGWSYWLRAEAYEAAGSLRYEACRNIKLFLQTSRTWKKQLKLARKYYKKVCGKKDEVKYVPNSREWQQRRRVEEESWRKQRSLRAASHRPRRPAPPPRATEKKRRDDWARKERKYRKAEQAFKKATRDIHNMGPKSRPSSKPRQPRDCGCKPGPVIHGYQRCHKNTKMWHGRVANHRYTGSYHCGKPVGNWASYCTSKRQRAWRRWSYTSPGKMGPYTLNDASICNR